VAVQEELVDGVGPLQNDIGIVAKERLAQALELFVPLPPVLLHTDFVPRLSVAVRLARVRVAFGLFRVRLGFRGGRRVVQLAVAVVLFVVTAVTVARFPCLTALDRLSVRISLRADV
jgi:hypothetical protein